MQNEANKPVVAAFDFDGTITYQDSLLPFLQFTSGQWKVYVKLLREIPIFFCFLVGIYSRQKAKERILAHFYRGMPLTLLKELGEAFAQEPIKKYLRPEALRRLEWHQKLGHRCILISASIDVYLKPWALSMGFQDVICSQVEANEQGLVTGRLLGSNCWGEEKVRRLEELLGPRDQYILHAYGDSQGDKPLLAYSDFPHFKKMPLPGIVQQRECLS